MTQPKTESPAERSARFSTLLAGKRHEMNAALRDANPGMTAHKANEVIDLATLRVASSTLESGTDFTQDTLTELSDRVQQQIDQRMKEKPYQGYRLG